MIRASLTFAILIAACVSPPSPNVEQRGDACGGTVAEVPIVDSPHVPSGTKIVWTSNPPTSGPHDSLWAKWDRSYAALAREHWLHDAEHGGVVFLYRCDVACPEIEAALIEVVRGLPDDPHCAMPVHHRALITADPLLPEDGMVAAVAWGVAYTASCVDADSLHAFYLERVGRAGENTCADGISAFGGTPLY